MDVPAELARQSIALTLDTNVEVFDLPGRTGAQDLNFHRDGRRVACEVKLVVDPVQRRAEDAAASLGYLEDQRLALSWTVRLRREASWRAAAARMPELLVSLEGHGWRTVRTDWHLRRAAPALHDEFDRLRVRSAHAVDPSEMHPPGYYLMPEGWGAWVPDVDELGPWAAELLAGERMRKLRRQLANAQADERHAFLWLGWEEQMANVLHVNEVSLPTTAPTLPAPVDAVWIGATFAGSRVLAWLPDRGWIRASLP
jgi:hypothetical protein